MGRQPERQPPRLKYSPIRSLQILREATGGGGAYEKWECPCRLEKRALVMRTQEDFFYDVK